jgi:hypothetical protein
MEDVIVAAARGIRTDIVGTLGTHHSRSPMSSRVLPVRSSLTECAVRSRREATRRRRVHPSVTHGGAAFFHLGVGHLARSTVARRLTKSCAAQRERTERMKVGARVPSEYVSTVLFER